MEEACRGDAGCRTQEREAGIETPAQNRRLAERLARQFHIEPGEAAIFGYFVLLFFILGAGLGLGRGSANALFLQRFGVTYLPSTYAVIALVLFATSIGYAALADRLRPERLLVGTLLILAGLLGIAWVGIAHADSAPAYPGYFVLFELASELLALHATLYFSCNFDSLQAKRLLPLGLAALQAGGMCGGIALAAIARHAGAEHAAAVWAGIAILSLVLVVRHHARHGRSPFFRPSKRGGSELRRSLAQIGQGIRFAAGSRLLRYASISIFCMVVALYCVSFASKAMLTAAFPGPGELAIVFGVLTFVTSASTLLLQTFFTGKMLQHFGIRKMNLVFPLTTLAVAVTLILYPGVAAALLVMLNRHIIMPAIRNPTRGLLFEALPDWMQGRARALSLGMVLPLALLATAALLQVLGSTGQIGAALPPAVLGAVLFLYFSIRTNAGYVESMLATLKEKLYLVDQQAGELGRGGDARLLDELVKGVMHPDEQVAIAYARVLTSGFPDRAAEVVLQRMQTASIRTRDALLRTVGPCLPRQLVEHLGVDGADAHETTTLRELHFRIPGIDANALIGQCLSAENPRLVACGIVGAYQHGSEDLARLGTQALATLLASARETTVLAGLEALRRVQDARHMPHLYRLIEQGSTRVQGRALQAFAALGQGDAARLEPILIDLYRSRDHQLRAACVACYGLLEPRIRDRLCLAALNDNHPIVAAVAMDILRHRSEDFDGLVSGWLCDEAARPRAREAALDYLKTHGLLPRLLPVVAEHRIAWAETLAQVLDLVEPQREGEAARARALFRIVVRERIEQSVDLALSALEPVVDSQRLRIVRASLRTRNRRQIARAIEALSHFESPLLSRRLHDLLLFLNGSAPARSGMLNDTVTALERVRRSTDTWLRQCAEVAYPALPGQRVAP